MKPDNLGRFASLLMDEKQLLAMALLGEVKRTPLSFLARQIDLDAEAVPVLLAPLADAGFIAVDLKGNDSAVSLTKLGRKVLRRYWRQAGLQYERWRYRQEHPRLSRQ